METLWRVDTMWAQMPSAEIKRVRGLSTPHWRNPRVAVALCATIGRFRPFRLLSRLRTGAVGSVRGRTSADA
eukprot:1306615-Pyramimonas_sp.AAC.1